MTSEIANPESHEDQSAVSSGESTSSDDSNSTNTTNTTAESDSDKRNPLTSSPIAVASRTGMATKLDQSFGSINSPDTAPPETLTPSFLTDPEKPTFDYERQKENIVCEVSQHHDQGGDLNRNDGCIRHSPRTTPRRRVGKKSRSFGNLVEDRAEDRKNVLQETEGSDQHVNNIERDNDDERRPLHDQVSSNEEQKNTSLEYCASDTIEDLKRKLNLSNTKVLDLQTQLLKQEFPSSPHQQGPIQHDKEEKGKRPETKLTEGETSPREMSSAKVKQLLHAFRESQRQLTQKSKRLKEIEADLIECSGVVDQLAQEKRKQQNTIRALRGKLSKCLCGAAASGLAASPSATAIGSKSIGPGILPPMMLGPMDDDLANFDKVGEPGVGTGATNGNGTGVGSSTFSVRLQMMKFNQSAPNMYADDSSEEEEEALINIQGDLSPRQRSSSRTCVSSPPATTRIAPMSSLATAAGSASPSKPTSPIPKGTSNKTSTQIENLESNDKPDLSKLEKNDRIFHRSISNPQTSPIGVPSKQPKWPKMSQSLVEVLESPQSSKKEKTTLQGKLPFQLPLSSMSEEMDRSVDNPSHSISEKQQSSENSQGPQKHKKAANDISRTGTAVLELHFKGESTRDKSTLTDDSGSKINKERPPRKASLDNSLQRQPRKSSLDNSTQRQTRKSSLDNSMKRQARKTSLDNSIQRQARRSSANNSLQRQRRKSSLDSSASRPSRKSSLDNSSAASDFQKSSGLDMYLAFVDADLDQKRSEIRARREQMRKQSLDYNKRFHIVGAPSETSLMLEAHKNKFSKSESSLSISELNPELDDIVACNVSRATAKNKHNSSYSTPESTSSSPRRKTNRDQSSADHGRTSRLHHSSGTIVETSATSPVKRYHSSDPQTESIAKVRSNATDKVTTATHQSENKSGPPASLNDSSHIVSDYIKNMEKQRNPGGRFRLSSLAMALQRASTPLNSRRNNGAAVTPADFFKEQQSKTKPPLPKVERRQRNTSGHEGTNSLTRSQRASEDGSSDGRTHSPPNTGTTGLTSDIPLTPSRQRRKKAPVNARDMALSDKDGSEGVPDQENVLSPEELAVPNTENNGPASGVAGGNLSLTLPVPKIMCRKFSPSVKSTTPGSTDHRREHCGDEFVEGVTDTLDSSHPYHVKTTPDSDSSNGADMAAPPSATAPTNQNPHHYNQGHHGTKRISISGATVTPLREDGTKKRGVAGRITVTLPLPNTVVPNNVMKSYWGSKVFGSNTNPPL